MMRIKTHMILVLVAIVGLSSVNTFADTAQENTTLSRISNILNAVYPLIAKAQKEADPNTRVKFRYDWLQKDIQAIQSGIAERINASKIEPRAIQPLKTHYIEQQNSRSLQRAQRE